MMCILRSVVASDDILLHVSQSQFLKQKLLQTLGGLGGFKQEVFFNTTSSHKGVILSHLLALNTVSNKHAAPIIS